MYDTSSSLLQSQVHIHIVFWPGLALPFVLKRGVHSTAIKARSLHRLPQLSTTGSLSNQGEEGPQEPSSRLPVGRAGPGGLSNLFPHEEECELHTTAFSQVSPAATPEHHCQPVTRAATKHSPNTHIPVIHRLNRLHNHRLQNTLINKGTKFKIRKAARRTHSSPKHAHNCLSPAFKIDPSGKRAQFRKSGT